LNLPH